MFACCRYDERVRDLLDFSIYLDISDDVKFAWKIQVNSAAPSLTRIALSLCTDYAQMLDQKMPH